MGLLFSEIFAFLPQLLMGQVKLTNIGEPRKVDFPSSPEEETKCFCYLPPEVLRGDVYKPRSDMYSLGLMAWELWNQEIAFKDERKTPLSQFLQNVSPSMLQGDANNPFEGLISGCVKVEFPEERNCSTTWVNELRKLATLCRQGLQEDDETSEAVEAE